MISDSQSKLFAAFAILILSLSLLLVGCDRAGAEGMDSDKVIAADTEREPAVNGAENTENNTEKTKEYAGPTASAVSLFVVNGAALPDAEDFVTNVTGEGEVTAEFAEEYDFSYPHDFDVRVILSDCEGNKTEVVAFAHCVVTDTTAPMLNVGEDIYVTVGGSVSYKADVTVSDNSGDDISLSIDNSEVDLDSVGAYTVLYSAVDNAGNEATEERIIYVTEELPPSEDEVLALAKDIFENEIINSKYVKDPENKYDVAYGIYKWCYKKITFDLAGTDRTKGPLKLAYDGFTTLKGDCYTYMITAKYLFEIAGIDTVEVTRMRYEGESNHFWLLVDVGDGYYHFDATTRTTGKGTDTFMLTDAEVAEFCERFNVPHYFRFDKTAYPARSVISYFENAIPD